MGKDMGKENLGNGLNRAQVCKRVGCGRTLFYELVAGGAFPHAYYVGKSLRIPESDVEDYRKSQQVNSPTGTDG